MISRKIRVAGKLLHFLIVQYPQSKFSIRLPRSVHLYISLSGAYCSYEDLASINPPDFLIPDIGPGEVAPSSQFLSYTCTEADTMLPSVSDPDSNFAIEVECVNGELQAPYWPELCEPEAVSTTQCGNFRIFLLLWILREINLGQILDKFQKIC